MRHWLGLLLLLCCFTSYGKERLPSDCSHLQSVTELDFVLFSKKEFIELGECLAINAIKSNLPFNMLEACNEVDEDRRNILGIFSLSKSEAIRIGQCVGAINYIYQRYNDEPVNHYSYRTYQCTKGIYAVDIIRAGLFGEVNRKNLRKALCHER
ncbi:hypothetical protein [Pseudoalteromonas spongiae]|uniref:hypothetical protein n=1 Tax=Pseudoalteromonas spongiae TaxID=298657 RepID=UPI00026C9A47|nr:hypothetical protein [Pseudoalteromonas spongiae]